MDDDDQMAAEAHQQALEQRQQEEERALNRCRALTKELREATERFESETAEHHERTWRYLR
jgi:hypothetical protein